MSLIWGLVALLVAMVAARCGVRAAQRALAGGLIGEISETLTLLETHDLEAALAHCGEGGLAPSLPVLPTLSYRADAGWMALLGAHLARLSASFYASAQALQSELSGLSSETAEAARAPTHKPHRLVTDPEGFAVVVDDHPRGEVTPAGRTVEPSEAHVDGHAVHGAGAERPKFGPHLVSLSGIDGFDARRADEINRVLADHLGEGRVHLHPPSVEIRDTPPDW